MQASARRGAPARRSTSPTASSRSGAPPRASGVRALLDPAALVSADLRDAAAQLGLDALDLALYGGEDYAVVVAGPDVGELAGFVAIGRCVSREEGASDVALLGPGGQLTGLVPRGYDHFA